MGCINLLPCWVYNGQDGHGVSGALHDSMCNIKCAKNVSDINPKKLNLKI